LLVLLLVKPSFADEGFYQLQQLQNHKNFKAISHAAQATLKISTKLDEENSSDCSAAFISNDGYVLTAMHCISSCLPNNVLRISGSEKEAYMLYEKTAPVKGLICADISAPELQLNTAEIVAIGKGFAEFDDLQIRKIPVEIRKKIFELRSDFAILKFKVPNPVKCLSLEKKPSFNINEQTFTLGFPSETFRNQYASDGVKLFISIGKITGNVSRSAYLTQNRLSNEDILKLLETHPSWDFFIDSDTTDGNSGSPVINEQGNLIGVYHSMMTADSQNQYVTGSSIALKITEIQNQLLSERKLSEIDTYFKCSN
jgi:S1-C subfamily serine protease